MRLALVLPALLAVAACKPVPPPPNPLAETVWSLQAIVQNGDSLTAESAGLPPDLLYFQSDGGVRVRSCNTCSGLYELSDLHVVIRRLACTEMACPAARVELDRYVAGRSAYRFTGDFLVLDVDDPINGIDARVYLAPEPLDVWGSRG